MGFSFMSKNGVVIDHLAFSFRSSNLKHCLRAREHFTFRDNSSVSRRFKEKLTPNFPVFPSFKRSLEKSDSENESIMSDFQSAYQICLDMTLFQLYENVFGFYVGSDREKGMFGYQKSYSLYDAETRKIPLGFIAMGGNNDTIYTQISGTGCKYLFEKISNITLYEWLNDVLDVDKLSRIDLAYDCFDGVFNCDYALKSYDEDAFYGGAGPYPILNDISPRRRDKKLGQTVYVGSRTSTVFWRVYDKAAEQKIPDLVWFRNEVELKKVKLDALLNPSGAFAGLCDFASSISPASQTQIKFKVKTNKSTLAGRIAWARKITGKLLYDLTTVFSVEDSFGFICQNEGGVIGLPDSYLQLINNNLNNRGIQNG